MSVKNVKMFGIGLLFLLVGFINYFSGFNNDFTITDSAQLNSNISIVQNSSDIKRIFTQPVWYQSQGKKQGFGGEFRPIATLIYSLEHQLGNKPLIYRVSNILFSCLNYFLIFLLFHRLGYQKNSLIQILFLLLLMVHPVNSEIAYSITGGKQDIFSLFFMLLSLHCFVSLLKSQKYLWIINLIFFYILSILTKEMGIVMFFWMSAIYLLKKNHQEFGENLKFKFNLSIFFWFLVTICYFVYKKIVFGSLESGVWHNLDFQGTALTMESRVMLFLTFTKAFWIYLGKILLWVTPDGNDALILCKSFLEKEVVLFAGMIIVLSLFTWKMARKNKTEYLIGIWLFIFSLIPVANLIPLKQFMAERFLYFPIAGLSFFFLTVNNTVKLNKGFFLTVFALLSLFFYQQNQIHAVRFKNDFEYSRGVFKSNPASMEGAYILAREYYERKEYENCQKTVELFYSKVSSDSWTGTRHPMEDLIFWWSDSLHKLGKDKENLEKISDIANLFPDIKIYQVLFNSSKKLLDSGNAEKFLKKVIELEGESPEKLFYLAMILADQKKWIEAENRIVRACYKAENYQKKVMIEWLKEMKVKQKNEK